MVCDLASGSIGWMWEPRAEAARANDPGLEACQQAAAVMRKSPKGGS
jgi:hypothetical protein